MHIIISVVKKISTDVINLLLENLPRRNGGLPRSVNEWRDTARRGWAVVASFRDKPVGAVLAYPRGLGWLYIGEIVVERGLRGRGIGRKLLQKMEERARKRGFEDLYLTSAEGVEEFYKKAGWWKYSYMRQLPRKALLKMNMKQGWMVADAIEKAKTIFRRPLYPSIEVRRVEGGYRVLKGVEEFLLEKWKGVIDHVKGHRYHEVDFVVPIRHQEYTGCWIPCVEMILEFFGKSYPLRRPLECTIQALYKDLSGLGMDVRLVARRQLITARNLRKLLREGYLLVATVNQEILYGDGIERSCIIVRGYRGRRFYVVDLAPTKHFGVHLVEGWRLLKSIYSAKSDGEVIPIRPSIE